MNTSTSRTLNELELSFKEPRGELNWKTTGPGRNQAAGLISICARHSRPHRTDKATWDTTSVSSSSAGQNVQSVTWGRIAGCASQYRTRNRPTGQLRRRNLFTVPHCTQNSEFAE